MSTAVLSFFCLRRIMNSSYVIYTSLPRTHTHSPSQTQTALLQSHGLQGDCHSPRFTNTFENVFSGDHLKSPFTFHVLAGKFPQFTPPPPGCLSFTATVLAFTPRCPCSFVWVVLANSLVHLCVFSISLALCVHDDGQLKNCNHSEIAFHRKPRPPWQRYGPD